MRAKVGGTARKHVLAAPFKQSLRWPSRTSDETDEDVDVSSTSVDDTDDDEDKVYGVVSSVACAVGAGVRVVDPPIGRLCMPVRLF